MEYNGARLKNVLHENPNGLSPDGFIPPIPQFGDTDEFAHVMQVPNPNPNPNLNWTNLPT